MEGHTFNIIILLLGCLELVTVNSLYSLPLLEVKTGYAVFGEGRITQIICSVKDTEDYYISWYRETPAGNRKAIYRNGTLINNNLGREAEAYSLHSQSDVIIEQVRGRDLGRLLDHNIYTCEVTEKRTGKVVLVSTGITLEARYSPSSLYPICEACDFSSELIGSNVTISCYSEIGNPQVQLQWSRNGQAIEAVQTTMTPFIYLNYTFILEAEDLESNFSCTNGKNSCKLKTNHMGTEEISPINSDAPQIPTSTVIVRTDKDEEESSPTIIVLSVIIAVLVTIVVIEAAVNILLLRTLRRYKKGTKGMKLTTPLVPDQAPDYINVKQSTDNRGLETYTDLNPREEANYSSLQNPQRKEDTEGMEMMTTVPDLAPNYINVKQSTANRKI